jgi:hypothetical protein
MMKLNTISFLALVGKANKRRKWWLLYLFGLGLTSEGISIQRKPSCEAIAERANKLDLGVANGFGSSLLLLCYANKKD